MSIQKGACSLKQHAHSRLKNSLDQLRRRNRLPACDRATIADDVAKRVDNVARSGQGEFFHSPAYTQAR